jgi:hypothetical protein
VVSERRATGKAQMMRRSASFPFCIRKSRPLWPGNVDCKFVRRWCLRTESGREAPVFSGS